MKTQPVECEMDDCDKPSLVGLNGTWVCFDHYEEGLRASSLIIKKAEDVLS